MNKIRELLRSEKFRELFRYGVFGLLTTLVNLAVYWLFMLPFGDNPANPAISAGLVVSWIAAVAFAYVTNKLYVFRSRGLSKRETLREAGAFLLARLFSLGFDVVFVLAMVNWLGLGDKPAKLISNVLVIVVNYALSKLVIFNRSR